MNSEIPLQNITARRRIKQSVCQWCYKNLTVPELAAHAAALGLDGIDLLTPEQWAPLKDHGLICTMTSQAGTIQRGLNRRENHGPIIEQLKTLIEQTADAGFPNVICFSGNRSGKNLPPISDAEGLQNCANAIRQVIALAERRNVTLCMELLNSKRDHKDYMCDRTHWGVQLCKLVGSGRFKLLYDIYHMQIMEGDVIQTLRDNIQYIGHIHTAGVPGRHEINNTQELNYPAIMRTLMDLNYTGHVAHEFIPAGPDPIASLAEAVRICDV